MRISILSLILTAVSHFGLGQPPSGGIEFERGFLVQDGQTTPLTPQPVDNTPRIQKTANAKTVEEVLAVIGNTPILYSDVKLAELVNLVERNPGATDEDHRSRLLDARILLEIQFRDLESSGQLYRIDLTPALARETLINRGGGELDLGKRMSAEGLKWSDLDALALRIAAVDAFVEQRLRPRVSVSLEEIEAAYRRLLVDEFVEDDTTAPPLNSVSDQIRTVLVERRLNTEIERWLELARERQALTRFSR